MSITVWDLFKYLFKWKFVIIIITVAAFLGASFYVDKEQTYTSKVIIQYLDGCISEGRTRDGQKFDSNEIKSPQVILNVLKELGYEQKKIDSVRNNIVITPVIPSSVDNIKASKEKLGDEYQYYPTVFTVTYKGDSSYEVTRDILSSVITNYFNYYTDKYLYLAALNEVDYNLNKAGFDYLEQAEIIRDNVKSSINALKSYEKDSAGYRSPETGLTFNDILKEFEFIDEYSLSVIFSKIYEGQVTLNKDLLIAKYTERMEDSERNGDNSRYKAELAEDRMAAYVEANKDVPNAYNEKIDENAKNIQVINEVDFDDEKYVDEQTTYDKLIKNYANDRIASNNSMIDADYCRTVIEKFTGDRDADIDYYEYEAIVQKEIDEILQKLSELYTLARINTLGYNASIPAHHIKKLSGVGYFENISGSLYKLLAIIGGLGLSCAVTIAYEIMQKYAKYSSSEKKDRSDTDTDEESDTDTDEEKNGGGDARDSLA